MSDVVPQHIAELMGGGPTGPMDEKPSDGTFDGGDQLLDGPLRVEDRAITDEGFEHEAHLRKPEPRETAPADEVRESGPEQLRAELERVKAESAGRMNDLAQQRARLREYSENMEEMRKMFVHLSQQQAEADEAKRRQAELEEEAGIYGEDVVNDPSARYIRDLIAANREQFEQYQQQQEHYRQQINEQRQQYMQEREWNERMLSTLKAQEDEFAAKTPDYYDAYQFARKKRLDMWQRRGYDEATAMNILRQEEQQLLMEQLPRGGNVAAEVYQIAKDWGWQGPRVRASHSVQGASPLAERVDAQADIERIRAGVGSRGAGQMVSRGGGGGSAGREMTREEFFSTVPPSKRTELFMTRPDVFEQLGRHGRVLRDWD